jgi:hypothetical protein
MGSAMAPPIAFAPAQSGLIRPHFATHLQSYEPARPASTARTVRSVDLRGPAGRLEAVLNEGSPDSPLTALICHPHPRGGGNLHNKVVFRAMKAFNDPLWGLGLPVLRFNFRGTGLSEGTHDGLAELEDVLAALDWLESEFKRPVIASGFSFGAFMALKASCAVRGADKVRALVALGLPIEAEGRAYDYSFLQNVLVPKLFLSGDRDAFAPTGRLRQVAESAAEPKRLVLIPNADHFFTGQLEPMQHALACWLKEQLV